MKYAVLQGVPRLCENGGGGILCHWRSGKKYLAHVVLFLGFVFQVANLACSISNNEEGVKLVRMAATQIDSLCPQVRTLKNAFTANIDIFKEALVKNILDYINTVI